MAQHHHVDAALDRSALPLWGAEPTLYCGRTATIGASPSGKAADFGSAIRRFESYRPSRRLHYGPTRRLDFGVRDAGGDKPEQCLTAGPGVGRCRRRAERTRAPSLLRLRTGPQQVHRQLDIGTQASCGAKRPRSSRGSRSEGRMRPRGGCAPTLDHFVTRTVVSPEVALKHPVVPQDVTDAFTTAGPMRNGGPGTFARTLTTPVCGEPVHV